MSGNAHPSALPPCARCGGPMSPGYETEQTCLWCGEAADPVRMSLAREVEAAAWGLDPQRLPRRSPPQKS